MVQEVLEEPVVPVSPIVPDPPPVEAPNGGFKDSPSTENTDVSGGPLGSNHDGALKKDLSEAFESVVETPALPEEPSLRSEIPEDWKDVPPISREEQGMKPRGRPTKPKRKAEKGVEEEETDKKKKPRVSKTSSKSKAKNVEDTKENAKTGGKKARAKKDGDEDHGKTPASSSKVKQEMKEQEGEKKKRKTSAKEKVEAKGSSDNGQLPLGTIALFTIQDSNDLESKLPQNDTKYTMMDWHLQFLVAQNGKTVFRFVNEHLQLDGVPLASDYPLTVCKGEVPGKDVEKEDKKREQKARISRKSAAYHRARKAVLEKGGTDEEAKEAGKEARLFCLCIAVVPLYSFLFIPNEANNLCQAYKNQE